MRLAQRRHTAALANRASRISRGRACLSMACSTANWIKISASVLRLSDCPSSGVHIPNLIRNPGSARDAPPSREYACSAYGRPAVSSTMTGPTRFSPGILDRSPNVSGQSLRSCATRAPVFVVCFRRTKSSCKSCQVSPFAHRRPLTTMPPPSSLLPIGCHSPITSRCRIIVSNWAAVPMARERRPAVSATGMNASTWWRSSLALRRGGCLNRVSSKIETSRAEPAISADFPKANSRRSILMMPCAFRMRSGLPSAFGRFASSYHRRRSVSPMDASDRLPIAFARTRSTWSSLRRVFHLRSWYGLASWVWNDGSGWRLCHQKASPLTEHLRPRPAFPIDESCKLALSADDQVGSKCRNGGEPFPAHILPSRDRFERPSKAALDLLCLVAPLTPARPVLESYLSASRSSSPSGWKASMLMRP